MSVVTARPCGWTVTCSPHRLARHPVVVARPTAEQCGSATCGGPAPPSAPVKHTYSTDAPRTIALPAPVVVSGRALTLGVFIGGVSSPRLKTHDVPTPGTIDGFIGACDPS